MSKNTIKKITSILLSIILSTSIFVLPSMFAGAVVAEKASWNFDSETGTLTFSGNGSMESLMYEWGSCSESVEEIYIEKGITDIPMFAFNGYKKLKKVTIPSSVEIIGALAFENCTSLENIVIPDGVVEIDSDAFHNCSSLKTVYIGKDLTDIDPLAFGGCESLESFTVSAENLVYSDDNGVIFNKDKTKLIMYPIGKTNKTYTVPDGVEIIGTQAFMNAKALENIYLPDSVIQIGGNPFGGTAFFGNEANWQDGVLYLNEKYLVSGGFNDEISGEYTVREGTKVIAGAAFMSCGLTSITIPASVVSVGEAALRCPNLSEIIIDEENPYLTSIDNVLFKKDMSELICYAPAKSETIYEIPSGVTKIANQAFANCSLNEVIIPEGVTEIGDRAFATSSVSKVNFPYSLVTVGNSAFYLTHLESASFGGNLKKIGDGAFDQCIYLTSVEFSEGITKIGEESFANCVKIESLAIPESIKEIDRKAFMNCGFKTLTIGVNPDLTDNLYSGKASETVIRPYAFNYCSNLSSAVVNVKNIGLCAFAVCDALESLTLFDGLKSIGYASFAECNNIEDIYFYGSEDGWNNVAIAEMNEEYLDGNFHTVYYNINSEKNGITFDYGFDCFDENIIFSVEKLDGTGGFIDGAISEMDGFNRIGMYVIKPLNDNGKVVQPNGKVEIRIPIPEGTDEKAEYTIVHEFSDKGNELFTTNPLIEEDKPLYIIDGYFVFEVDHFSKFIVFVKSNEPDTPVEKTVSSISITTLPSKTDYTYKMDNLDLSGLTLTVTYSDGTTETVTDTSAMKVTGFNNAKVGTQTLTVEYEDTTTTFNVSVSYAWWQWIIRILLLGFLWY